MDDRPFVVTERQLLTRDLWSTFLGIVIGAAFTSLLYRFPEVMTAVAWVADAPIWSISDADVPPLP